MNIAVINTGGTISCVGNPLAPMTASAFAAACQTYLEPILVQQSPLLSIHYIVDLFFPESASNTLDSTNLQPIDWCLIAGYILDHYSEYDGWVLLHGTDSMDYTGTALAFLLSSFDTLGMVRAALSKPIIITGSQVPMFYQASTESGLSINNNTDAFQNFCGAIAAAQTQIPEVCVYFHNSLLRGNRILKTNASEFDAFSSPNYPAMGEYGISLKLRHENIQAGPVSPDVSLDNPLVRSGVGAQLEYIVANINRFAVMQFNAFPAWYDSSTSSAIIANLITACVEQGIKGLILQSYGEGNFPSGNPDNPPRGAIYQALKQANAAGVQIVNCTHVIRGTVNSSAYASGAWLADVGALNPADMTPMAALAKLMILLASADFHGWTDADVKNLFQWNLLGEMQSVSRMDSRSNHTLLSNESICTLDGSAMLINDPVRGPLLKTSSGAVLWSAFTPSDDSQLPGRLTVNNNGSLVFYDRNNQAVWATDTDIRGAAPSVLMLSGSISDNTLALQLYNYLTRRISKTLFALNQPGGEHAKEVS